VGVPDERGTPQTHHDGGGHDGCALDECLKMGLHGLI
jgi:hypothetical protein